MYDVNVFGTEGLPNLYISNIFISDNNDAMNGGITIEVEYLYYNALDVNSNPLFEPSADPQYPIHIKDHLILKKEITNKFLNFENDYTKSEEYSILTNNGVIKTTQISINPNTTGLSFTSLTPRYIRKKYVVESGVTDVSIVSYFTNTLIDGPAVAETILTSGRVQTNSILFKYKNENTIWTGPVHRHPGRGFMVGSFHMDSPHSELERISYMNLKIKDFRNQKEAPNTNTLFNTSDNSRLFSPLKSSRANGANSYHFFSIDVGQMLLRGNKYGKTLARKNMQVFERLSSNTTVDLDVYIKNKTTKYYKNVISVKGAATSNRKQTTFFDIYGNLFYENSEDNLQVYATLEEMNITSIGNPSIRDYCLFLEEETIDDIKIVATVSDPFEQYITGVDVRNKQAIKDIKRYGTVIRKQATYDAQSNRLKERAVADNFDNSITWSNSLNVLMETITLTEGGNLRNKINKYINLIAPRACTIESIDKYQKVLFEKYKKFIRLYSPPSLTPTTSPAKGRTNLNNRKNTYSKIYNVNIKKNTKKMLFVSNSINTKSIPVFSVSEMLAALQLENVKTPYTEDDYVTSVYAENPDVSAGLGISPVGYYFSPRSIKNSNKEYVFYDVLSLDEDTLEGMVDNKKKNNISISVYNEQETSKVNMSDLNENENFESQRNENDRDIKNILVKEAVFKNISRIKSETYRQASTILRLTDIATKDNLFSNKTQQDIARVPRHHRYMTSLPEEQRKAILINKPLSRDLAFFNIKKIVYLQSYSSTKQGAFVGSEQMTELTEGVVTGLQQPILCKMVPYYEPNVTLKNNFEDFEAAYSVFVLVPDNYVIERREAQTFSPRHTNVFNNTIRRYGALDLFETQFLRGAINKEHMERKKKIRSQKTISNPVVERIRQRRMRKQQDEQNLRNRSRMDVNLEKEEIMKTKASPQASTQPTRGAERSVVRLDTTRETVPVDSETSNNTNRQQVQQRASSPIPPQSSAQASSPVRSSRSAPVARSGRSSGGSSGRSSGGSGGGGY